MIKNQINEGLKMLCPECNKEMTEKNRVKFHYYTEIYYKCENPECKVKPFDYDVELMEFD